MNNVLGVGGILSEVFSVSVDGQEPAASQPAETAYGLTKVSVGFGALGL